MASKRVRTRVVVRPNHTLVIRDADGEPYIEIRPGYNAGIGPLLTLYRVNEFEPEYLATLPLPVIGPLVQKLPIAISAARRLAKAAGTNDGTEPNTKPDSNSP